MQTPIGHLLCLSRSSAVYAVENYVVSAPTLFRKILCHIADCLVAIEKDSMTLRLSYDVVGWIVRIHSVTYVPYSPRTRHRIYTSERLLVEWCIRNVRT